MSNQNKTNLTHANDGFSGVTTANKSNKSIERGFSGVVSSNSKNSSKTGSANSNQSSSKNG